MEENTMKVMVVYMYAPKYGKGYGFSNTIFEIDGELDEDYLNKLRNTLKTNVEHENAISIQDVVILNIIKLPIK